MRTASLYQFFIRLGKYFSSPRNILQIVLLPLVFFYSNGGRLWGLEDKALRWWSNIAASPRTNLMATVVGIDSSDYKNIFNETSPLNADTLKKAIERILQFEPAVLGGHGQAAADALDEFALVVLRKRQHFRHHGCRSRQDDDGVCQLHRRAWNRRIA